MSNHKKDIILVNRRGFLKNSAFITGSIAVSNLPFSGVYAKDNLVQLPDANPASSGTDISQYNVIWESSSENSFGSMPLGNGDIGLNVWVEKNGDLLFYISKVDAFDAAHLLPQIK